MGRSFSHSVEQVGPHDYRLAWTIWWETRHRRVHYTKMTGRAGALRFAQRWGVQITQTPSLPTS